MRRAVELVLSDEERATLERYVRRGTTAQRLVMRARIVLLCAEGLENQQVGRRLRMSAFTVGKWRRRFAEDRLDGLLDESRPGAPRKISDDAVEPTARAKIPIVVGTEPRRAPREPLIESSLYGHQFGCV